MQYGGRRRGPLPGRVSTFFNSPYARQISDNLSAAIYGDPRDDLTREQITNAQVSRQRQADQDAIAAQEKLEARGFADTFAASMMEAAAEPDPEKRRILQTKAAADHFRATGKIDPTMLPYTQNQQWQGKSQLSSQEHGQTLGRDQLLHLNDLEMEDVTFGNDLFMNQTEFGQQGQRDSVLHRYDQEMAGVNHKYDSLMSTQDLSEALARDSILNSYDVEDREDTQLYDSAESLLDRSGDSINKLISEGLWSENLAEGAGFTPQSDASILPNGELDPTSAAYGSGGGTALDVSPSDIDKGQELLIGKLADTYGSQAVDYGMESRLKQSVMRRASEIYQQNRNWDLAAAQAIAEMTTRNSKGQIIPKPANAGDDLSTALGIIAAESAPAQPVNPESTAEVVGSAEGQPKRIRFDKNGNVIP